MAKCDTNPIKGADQLLCFKSNSAQGVDGCFDPVSLKENENFYLNISADDTWLGVRGINPSLNGTVISIFCTPPELDGCPNTNMEFNIFNFQFITNGNQWYTTKLFAYYYGYDFLVCDNCSSNATCEEGVCVCKPGYSGDGMMCGKFSMCYCMNSKAACGNITCSPNATCKEVCV